MAFSLNKVCVLGNVGRDPEIRSLQSGDKMANITVATEESWIDKSSGERKKRTEWHRVVVWNKMLVGIIEKHVKKGTKLYLEGSNETRKWTDQQGNERYSTEVVIRQFGGEFIVLDGRRGDGDRGGEEERQAQPAQRPAAASGTPSWDAPRGGSTGGAGYDGDLDDAIPFSPEWR